MNNLYCIACPSGCLLTLSYVKNEDDEDESSNKFDKKDDEGEEDEEESPGELVVEGNKCDKGYEFALAETTNPTRILTTTVRTSFPEVPVVSVRTDGEIPKASIPQAMDEINQIVVSEQLECGASIIDNVAETGVRVIITSPFLMKLGEELENKNADITNAGAGRSDNSNQSAYAGRTDAGGVVDNLGPESADGFVGAAGEAVGVDGDGDGKPGGGEDGKEIIPQRGRPHIRG